MRRKVSLFSRALIFFALCCASVGVSAADEIKIIAPASTLDAGELARLLDRGQKLESQQRWGEALSLYEEALREHPQQQDLSSRHELAKLHYDIGRRYNDNSFTRALGTLPERQAQALYSEVLLKIQSHYVTEPNWQGLIDRGTNSLKVALGEAAFAKRNMPGRSPSQVQVFRARLPQIIAARPVRNRQDALDTVTIVARQAQQELGIPATATMLEYTCGATGALDEYSSYLTGDQLTDIYSQIEGNFVGLGIELKADGNGLLIVKVITGSPAERGGIRAGDRILSVNGTSTKDLTTDQAAGLLQGAEGTTVDVLLASPKAQQRRLSVRREHVDVPSVDEVKIVDRDYGIGYLKLTCFQKTTSRDLDAALWKLHREGMKSLVMDLRGNPGGLLTAAVEVADKFVEEGVIVSTRGRSAVEDYNYTAHKVGTWRMPLVVLIDGESASASEIFAGAIRDHRRGTIVGQRSYGKGSVQGIFPLTVAGAGVRLTTAKFYSPSGHPISKVGVHPDIHVQRVAKPTESQIAASEDAVMSAGLQAARGQTAKR